MNTIAIITPTRTSTHSPQDSVDVLYIPTSAPTHPPTQRWTGSKKKIFGPGLEKKKSADPDPTKKNLQSRTRPEPSRAQVWACPQLPKEHRIFTKKEQKYVRQPTFLSLCMNDSCDAKTYCIIVKKVREGFMIFCRAFSNT